VKATRPIRLPHRPSRAPLHVRRPFPARQASSGAPEFVACGPWLSSEVNTKSSSHRRSLVSGDRDSKHFRLCIEP
jgi:hypothetical protein